MHSRAQIPSKSLVGRSSAGQVLQRRCTCGSGSGPSGECASCRRKRRLGQQGATLQAHLRVGPPGDRYEQEADRVADAVVRAPASTLQPSLKITPLVQRQVEEEEEEEELVQPKATGVPDVSADTAAGIAALRGGGAPLPAGVRTVMEHRMGQDFSGVRVHTGGRASSLARSVGAKAFTVGRDVVFGAGAFRPATRSGAWLLAHELTHVVQQGEGRGLRVQRLGDNPDCSDDEADAIHQAIYNARGWLNKAIAQLTTEPLPQNALRSLRRNFGSTYGVAANAPMIARRLRVAYRGLSTYPIGCDGAADHALCAARHCGYADIGSHEVTICTNATLAPGTDWRFQAGCVLHETLHAAFSRFTVDEYSGWHGVSGSTPAYPGAGTDPLLNADSYTTLAMDLS